MELMDTKLRNKPSFLRDEDGREIGLDSESILLASLIQNSKGFGFQYYDGSYISGAVA